MGFLFLVFVVACQWQVILVFPGRGDFLFSFFAPFRESFIVCVVVFGSFFEPVSVFTVSSGVCPGSVPELESGEGASSLSEEERSGPSLSGGLIEGVVLDPQAPCVARLDASRLAGLEVVDGEGL